MILNFRQSTKQSEVAEFGITKLALRGEMLE